MKAVALVAHPDDCVIFARPFIDANKDFDWTIVYLTYSYDDFRSREISKYWNSRNVSTRFLGFIDDYRDMELNEISFSIELAKQQIIKNVDGADIILTHGVDGEYGHIHHKFVNTVADSIDIPKVYFSNSGEEYVSQALDLEEFPLHRKVIEGFKNRDIGRYIVTDSAKNIIRKNN